MSTLSVNLLQAKTQCHNRTSQSGYFGEMLECDYLRSMKENVIREIRAGEIPLLDDFLYEAIFIPDGAFAVVPEIAPRSISGIT